MLDYMAQVSNEEHHKDLQRRADNDRLARIALNTESSFLQETREMIGRNLVKVGQTLLNEKQR